MVAENQLENTYDPGMLDYKMGYYWWIVAKDNHGASNESEVWRFAAVSSPGSDLVAKWDFDDGAGSVAYDSSGNGNDLN